MASYAAPPLRGFAWTPKSRRFWRKLRLEAEPRPKSVSETVRWLKEKDLARKERLGRGVAWVDGMGHGKLTRFMVSNWGLTNPLYPKYNPFTN